MWRRELPGGAKGSPRRSGAQGAAPSPPCLVLPPRGAVGGGRVQLLRLPASSSPCANTRGLGKYLPSHSPGRLIVREHGRGHRGSSCARGELGVSVGAQGCPQCPWLGAAAHRDGRMQFLVTHSGCREGADFSSAAPGRGLSSVLTSPRFYSPPRWPAAAPRGPAPSPTPTPPPAPITSEGRAGKEGGCCGEGAAAAPHSRGSSTGPGHIPRCCSAPRRGQREQDGSGAAGFVHMTELDEQRSGAGGRVPHTPRSLHSLGFATLLHAGGGGLGLCSPCAHPRGFNGSFFCGVILYKYLYLRGVGAGLGSAGW